MKKYVKPDFYYENFQLSNYAAGCASVSTGVDGVKTANNPNNCVYRIAGVIAYFNQGTACKEWGELPEGYCLQNGGDSSGGTSISVTWS